MNHPPRSVQEIQDVVAALEPRLRVRPEVAIIIGSGLGALLDRVEDAVEIPFEEIPHFQPPSVEGLRGRVVSGRLNGVGVIVLHGRWHFYEGYSMNSVVIPTRAFASLGAHTLVLTNAAGGVNLDYQGDELMLITDHLNLMGDNPLTGRDSVMFGPRFPDMSEAYCRECTQILERSASRLGIPLRKGVYAGMRGPVYETPAEVRMVRTMGADALGMTSVPEAIAARHLGMRVVGLSLITNRAAGLGPKLLDHNQAQSATNRLTDQVARLLVDSLPEIARNPEGAERAPAT